MADEYDEAQMGDESMTGPGAPTPLSALEVPRSCMLPYWPPIDQFS